MLQEEIQLFFEEFSREKPESFIQIPQSGSSRKNFIAKTKTQSYVVTFNDNQRENEAFFYFSDVFNKLQLNTPKIFKISEDRTLYIQEFLGNNTLSEIIEKEGTSDRVKKLVKETLDLLYHLQTKTLGKVDYSKTYEYESYNELPIMHDLYYFKNYLADVLEIPYHKSALLKEFKNICQKIEQLEPKVLMIRDFQSRNIMVNKEGQVFFIDYQSAMEGPAMYDVVSFLYQAKANFPEVFRTEMQQHYINKFDAENQVKLNVSVNWLKFIRYLQVLGAYGFRGLIQRKNHFINSLDQGIENLYQFSEHWEEMKHYPELNKLIKALKSKETQIKINKILHQPN